MSKLIEVIDSLNDEMTVAEVRETLKAEADALEKNNSQLYQRAKKAEGFEYDKNSGKWVKNEKKISQSSQEMAGQPGEFDYGQKAFISNALGVKINDQEQIALVKEYIANGKKLDDLIDNKYFKNDLKEIIDNQEAKNAFPSGTRGSGSGSSKDSVDYYLNKGELPPADKPELRRQYVNERYKREKSVSHFAK